MKWLILVLLVACATMGLAQAKFDTQRFDASFKIAQDGTFQVTESITVDFHQPQHGIVRQIPLNTGSATGKVRTVYVSVGSVTANGQPVHSQTKEQGGDLSIRVGSADIFVNGRVTYRLQYTVDGAITPIDKADQLGKRSEFFWNLLPTAWPTSIGAGTMTITYPTPEPGRLVARVLAGELGTRKGIQVEPGKPPIGRSDLIDVQLSAEGVVVSLKRPLPKGKGITAAVALPGNTVVPRSPTIQQQPEDTSAPTLELPKGPPWLGLLAAIPGLIVFMLARRLWPSKERPLVVKFDAPPNIGPSLSGTIIDGQVNPRDVVAGIVSLAQKGALRLHHPQVEGQGISIELVGIEKARGTDYSEQYLYASLAQYGGVISSDMLRGSFGGNYQQIQRILIQDAVDRGLFSQSGGSKSGFGCLLVGLTAVAAFGLCVFQPVFTVFGVLFSLILGSVGISKISYVTRPGQLVRRELQGLKEFITRANQKEMNYMAQIDPDQALFEKLLPYAIAFDAVKQWTEAFRGLDLVMPDWYDVPGYGYGGDMFWTMMLLNDLTYFQNDYGDAMSYTPPPIQTSDFGTGGLFSSGDSAFGDSGGGGWSDSGGGGFDGGFSSGDGGGGGGGDSW
jgi:uncharacterized membrane protein YgcG